MQKMIVPCRVEPVVWYVALQRDKNVPTILNLISKIRIVYFNFKQTKSDELNSCDIMKLLFCGKTVL
jgi:hypothetical protein